MICMIKLSDVCKNLVVRCAHSDLYTAEWTQTNASVNNSCIYWMWLHRYNMCMRFYRSGSLADGALGVICTSSCAWRECYSKAWLWNALFKHYRPAHTLHYVPFTCWLKTSGWHLSRIKWCPLFMFGQIAGMSGCVYLLTTDMSKSSHGHTYSCTIIWLSKTDLHSLVLPPGSHSLNAAT